METVSHILEPALQRRTPDVPPARHAALLRWHADRPLRALALDQVAHPAFPLIEGAGVRRTFAPVRGTPRPAA